jgi:hypothetical protein
MNLVIKKTLQEALPPLIFPISGFCRSLYTGSMVYINHTAPFSLWGKKMGLELKDLD